MLNGFLFVCTITNIDCLPYTHHMQANRYVFYDKRATHTLAWRGSLNKADVSLKQEMMRE